jgi:hypothetical protein
MAIPDDRITRSDMRGLTAQLLATLAAVEPYNDYRISKQRGLPTLPTDMNKKIFKIPVVSISGLTENGRAEGAMLHKNWKVVSGALTYEASRATTLIPDGLGLRSFLRGIGRSRVLAHWKVL